MRHNDARPIVAGRGRAIAHAVSCEAGILIDGEPSVRSDDIDRHTDGVRSEIVLRLVRLRALAVGALAVGLLAVELGLGLSLPTGGLAALATGLAVFDVFAWRRARRFAAVSEMEVFLHLVVDVTALSAVLYLTGGATNPLVVLYLVPLTVAATILSGRFTWAMAGLTAAANGVLLGWFQSLDWQYARLSGFELHVVGMWLAYLITAVVVAYFVAGMGRSLRRREAELAAARERVLRDEQLVTLGTLAANTVHEIATPLGTVQLLAEEIEEARSGSGDGRSMQLLRQEVERCSGALSHLAEQVDGVALSTRESLDVEEFLLAVLENWRQRHPEVEVDTCWRGPRPAPAILADHALRQALVNILSNAAEAAPQAPIECEAQWGSEELWVEVRDRGPGLPASVRAKLGRQPYSRKPHGLGLGLLLTHGVIERLGGSVTWREREGGGLATRIDLPLTNPLRSIAPGGERSPQTASAS